jgi:hypothetical protein
VHDDADQLRLSDVVLSWTWDTEHI